jgi:hypothetical protein
MFSLIFGLILLFAAAIAVWLRHDSAVKTKAGVSKQIPYLGWAALALSILGVLVIAKSSLFQVPTKEEAILTSFGTTSGNAGSGLHLKKPWEKVHNMDAAIQTDTFSDNSSNDKCLAIPVRIAFQQTGCASVSIQWRIVPNSAPELYKDFRSFDHVRDALVTRKLTQALNVAFANYNPLNIATEESGKKPEETLPAIAAKVKTAMSAEVGKQVEVLSVLLPIVTYDPATQGRINQLQQQVALTRIAEQKLTTNKKEAAANAALAQSVNNSPNVLVSRCLDTLEAMVKAGQSVPAGFSCWPGGSLAGVIAGSK